MNLIIKLLLKQESKKISLLFFFFIFYKFRAFILYLLSVESCVLLILFMHIYIVPKNEKKRLKQNGIWVIISQRRVEDIEKGDAENQEEKRKKNSENIKDEGNYEKE